MTAMLAKPLPTSYDSMMRPPTPLYDRTITNASRDRPYNTYDATGLHGKKGVTDASTKSSVLEHGHLPTSRLVNVHGKRRRRDVSRENHVPTPAHNALPAKTRHRVAADIGPFKINAFEEDVNPFIDPDREWDVSPEPSHTNTASCLEPVSSDSLDLDADATSLDEETFIYTPQSPTTTPADRPDRRASGERKSTARPRRRPWKAPGPSPLKVAHHIIADHISTQMLPRSDLAADETSFVGRPLRIHPLPRTLAGKHRGRVAITLLYSFLTRAFLRRIYSLDVESPELDFVDAETVEFFLDLQVDLLRGFVTIPSLSSYAIATRSTLGTPRRRFLWRAGQTFPRRLEDYERAAAKLLARKRASAYQGVA
ncbi:hypothetical protein C8T65DRAFT_647322 [Cerioporus squamosus]|nr:hypothetical protein C8T65DRAFT_647322 [Cerioporus squamosus]